MASMIENLLEQLGGDTMSQVSRQVGMTEEDTSKAMPEVLAVLTGALARNSNQADGANALSAALDKDHDGSILDNLPDFINNFQSGAGDGILRHVLGERRGEVEKRVSEHGSFDMGTISKLFTMLAPIIMGMLGRTKKQSGLDLGGLTGLLGMERQEAERRVPQTSDIFTQLLDADGDGQITDDIGKIGTGLLGKLFGGKK
jgi:hypothetical protein